MLRIKKSYNLNSCFFSVYLVYFVEPLNEYNLKAFSRPNITLAKIISSGFFSAFSHTIFHVLQTDSSHCKRNHH